MENKALYPALLNEKDCSADFVEEFADAQGVIWNRKDGGRITGLFFLENKPVHCSYNPEENSMDFVFYGGQMDSFLEMLSDVFKITDEVLVVPSLKREEENKITLLFFMNGTYLA